MSEQKIEVGQVYRERDSRFVRYAKIVGMHEGVGYAIARTCHEDGSELPGSPRTRIKLENLARRFTLVSLSHADKG